MTTFDRKLLTLLLPLLALAAPVAAQNDNRPRPAAPAAAAEVDVDDERVALAFAGAHHAELARLLGPMKAAHPREYQKAIRELFRASDRLSRIQARSADRYELELAIWKSESRLRLVAAQSAMVDDDERREQIEKLVTERNSLRVRLFELEIAESEARIAQLNRQIETLKGQESEAVRREVDRLVNTAKSSANRVKTKLQKPPEAVSPPIRSKSGEVKRAPGDGSASE